MFGRLRWGSSDAFGSAFLGLSVWELCFSLVSPLWESCYSLALGYGMRLEGGGGGGGGGASFAPHSLFSSLSSSLSSIPLLPSSIPLLFSFLFPLFSSSTAFSSVSSSFSLLCPHLFLFFSSFLSSFHYVFLLCLPSSSLSFINRFLLCPRFFLFEGIVCIQGISCTVCLEGIACTVCLEGIACTV